MRTESEGNAKHKPLTTKHKTNYTADDYSLSVEMYEAVVFVVPHAKKPNYESWANTIRLMREVDKIPIQTIQQVFKWANKDSFWNTNILSAAKLRDKFPTLHAKMEANNGQNQSLSNPGANKLTPAQRTRAKADKWRSEQECNVEAMGSDAGDVRPHMEQPVRGRTDRDMGEIIDGDFSRAD